MRNALFAPLLAALLAAPALALAQTPKDIANQIWPEGAPVSTNQAPHEAGTLHGGGTGLDLARLAGIKDHAAASPVRTGTAYVASFTAADLARLRGDQTQPSGLFLAPVNDRIVAR